MTIAAMSKQHSNYDPIAKEEQLRDESASWDTRNIEAAEPSDIPVLDLSDYFNSPDTHNLDALALQLREACMESGFFSIIGHGIGADDMQQSFAAAKRFFDLSAHDKHAMRMDAPDWPHSGVGYLPVDNRKLPTRKTGNFNEALVIKKDHALGLQDNRWPPESLLPGFRRQAYEYARKIEALARRLLPVYARALQLEENFFDEAFADPMYRLRFSHYPELPANKRDEYGISPHVDTSFFTILAQDGPGLVIFSERRQVWIHAPMVGNAFVVNTGELLKQWSNDLFISVKHFANNNSGSTSRYSIPFFFNANANYRMSCLPSCHGPDRPIKYPPFSYLESQASVQGE